jgi:hypothetical protein
VTLSKPTCQCRLYWVSLQSPLCWACLKWISLCWLSLCMTVIMLTGIMLTVIMLTGIMLTVIMLSFNWLSFSHHYADCNYPEYQNAKCHYAKCRGANGEPCENWQLTTNYSWHKCHHSIAASSISIKWHYAKRRILQIVSQSDINAWCHCWLFLSVSVTMFSVVMPLCLTTIKLLPLVLCKGNKKYKSGWHEYKYNYTT